MTTTYVPNASAVSRRGRRPRRTHPGVRHLRWLSVVRRSLRRRSRPCSTCSTSRSAARHGHLDDAGRLTPAEQDRVVDRASSARRASARVSVRARPASRGHVDVPRLMLRAKAMQHRAGIRSLRSRLRGSAHRPSEARREVGRAPAGTAAAHRRRGRSLDRASRPGSAIERPSATAGSIGTTAVARSRSFPTCRRRVPRAARSASISSSASTRTASGAPSAAPVAVAHRGCTRATSTGSPRSPTRTWRRSPRRSRRGADIVVPEADVPPRHAGRTTSTTWVARTPNSSRAHRPSTCRPSARRPGRDLTERPTIRRR